MDSMFPTSRLRILGPLEDRRKEAMEMLIMEADRELPGVLYQGSW